MKILQSLKVRIIFACAAFALLVNIGYGQFVVGSLEINDDQMFNWYMADQAENFLEEYQKGTLEAALLNEKNRLYIGEEAQAIEIIKEIVIDQEYSEQLKAVTTLDEILFYGTKNITDQGYQIFEFGTENKYFHVLRADLVPTNNNSNQKLYYIIDVSGYDDDNNFTAQKIYYGFLFGVIIVSLLAIVLGNWISKSVISPLTQLTKSVDQLDVEDYYIEDGQFYKDEVGILAAKINSFLNRISEFIEREKSFTRDASHELRTPIASSRAAIDIALSSPEGQTESMSNLLNRVKRANMDMSHLIETFLLLGREQTEKEEKTTFILHELILDGLNDNAYLKRKEVTCLVQIDPSTTVFLPRKHLSIVLNNLIRNALQHTSNGEINIEGDIEKIKVTDSGAGFVKEEQTTRHGSGIGLKIVKRISKIHGWRLKTESLKGVGSVVTINFV